MKAINIVLFWFNDDWGQFGRAYERVAESLSRLDEVAHVTCVFPFRRQEYAATPAKVWSRTVSAKLTLSTETLGNGQPKWWRRVLDNSGGPPPGHMLRDHFRSKGLKSEDTLLWLFPPHPYLDVVRNSIPHFGVVAHVIDDFTKFDPGHELYAHAHAQYPEIWKWADVIVTTSIANREKFSQTTKPCYLFGPAVDESFFAIPSELPIRSSIGQPHLGYVGWIMDRTDLDLIAFIARSRPNWHISLVGPEYPEGLIAKSGLASIRNIEYRGAIPQDAVPMYLQSLDVCLIPHKDNEYSRSMGPLKLYQYLASGRPIVSTKIAGLEDAQRLLYIAEDYEDFVRGIESSIANDNAALAETRVAFARLHTWDVRVKEIFRAVCHHFPAGD